MPSLVSVEVHPELFLPSERVPTYNRLHNRQSPLLSLRHEMATERSGYYNQRVSAEENNRFLTSNHVPMSCRLRRSGQTLPEVRSRLGSWIGQDRYMI